MSGGGGVLAFSYLRFSTPEQMKGDSYRRQLKATTEFAARMSWRLSDVPYFDRGRSAFRGGNVQDGKLGDFLAAVESGAIPQGSVLIIEALDRLTRQDPWDAVEVLRRIIKAGVRIATTMNGRIYGTESASGGSVPFELIEMVILLGQGHEESLKKSHRLKESWETKRQHAEVHGTPMTARAPAWLRVSGDGRRYEVIEDRSRVVRRIFRDFLAGQGTHSIATALNVERVPTFGSSPQWQRSYVLKILENRAVIGEFTPHVFVYEGGIRTKQARPPLRNYFPAVVSEGDFNRVQAMRSQRRAPSVRRGKPGVSHILAGLARCPRCRGSMARVNKGSSPRAGKPRLVCQRAKYARDCDAPQIPLHVVEEVVLRALPELAQRGHPGLSRQARESRDMMVSQREKTQRKLDSLIAAMMGDGEQREEARRELDVLPAVGAQVRKLEAKLRDIDQWLEDFALKEQQYGPRTAEAALLELREAAQNGCEEKDIPKLNALLRQLVERVIVDFDNGSIDFVWHSFGGRSKLPCPEIAERH